MQGRNIYIQQVTIFILNSYRFLHPSIGFYFLQSAVYTYTMINMRYIISGLQFTQCF